MGYRANSVARSLRTRQREAIGLVIPDAANPGFAEIFKGVQAVTAEAGWHVIVVEGRPTGRPDLGWDRIVLEGRVDGVLVLVASIRDPSCKRVAESGFPIVLVNRRSNGVAGSVVMNDARGSDVAVEHFFGLGHRKIGHIAGPANLDTGRRRLAGFRDALKQRKLGAPRRMDRRDRLHRGRRRRAPRARFSTSRTATCRPRSTSRASCRASARSRSSRTPG